MREGRESCRLIKTEGLMMWKFNSTMKKIDDPTSILTKHRKLSLYIFCKYIFLFFVGCG